MIQCRAVARLLETNAVQLRLLRSRVSFARVVFLIVVVLSSLMHSWATSVSGQVIIQDGDSYFVQGEYPPGFQVNADKTTTVTAQVPDTTPPSTPLLVAPPDGSELTDNTPTFVWTGVTDDVGVAGYTLYLDGVPYFNAIPTSDTETGTYILTYDSILDQYSLTPKSSIGEGNHTWKIVAYDAAGNTTSSTTWSLLIDSQAPTFIIKKVGDKDTSISVQDDDTIPTSPIELNENEPVLSGTGEANSSVRLQIHRKSDGQLIDEIEFEIGGDGTWSVKLDTLERGPVYLLTFQITDRVGLLSVLADVPIRIKPFVIEIPIPEIPLLPGGELPIEGPIIIPIPIVPFETMSRIIHSIDVIIDRAADRVITTLVPESVRATFASATASSHRFLSPIWYTHLLVLLLLAILPLTKFVLLALPFGRAFSISIGRSIWLAILGYAQGQRASLAIDAADQHALAYLTVRVVLLHAEEDVSYEAAARESRVLLTDEDGYLPPISESDGTYILKATIDEEAVDFAKQKPAHLEWKDWYQGQPLELGTSQSLAPLVLALDGSIELTRRSRFKRWLLRRPIDALPTLLLAVAILVITPTIGNFITLVVFGAFWLAKSWRTRSTNYQLAVFSTSKLPLPLTVLRLTDQENRRTSVLHHVDTDAAVSLTLKNGSYECQAINAGYRQKQAEMIELNDESERTHLIILIEAVG